MSQIEHNATGRSDSTDDPLADRLAAAAFVSELFDRIPDVVYFVKDPAARYRWVNDTLVRRCGATSKGQLIGRTAAEVFPEPLGERYLRQDLDAIHRRQATTGKLELHLFADGRQGWCLTDKRPLISSDGRVLGLVGISRDLHMPDSAANLQGLSRTLEHMHTAYGETLRIENLAARSGMSTYRFSRRIREIFQITPNQLITRIRINAASELLRTTELRVAEIAQRCGYCDQSAFTRQFRAVCGLTPTQYRDL